MEVGKVGGRELAALHAKRSFIIHGPQHGGAKEVSPAPNTIELTTWIRDHLRLDVNEVKQVIGVTMVIPNGHMQVGVFAAPRNEGIWDDIRPEIVESVKSQKGVLKERADGPFGVELVGTVRGDGGMVPVRFIGIHGTYDEVNRLCSEIAGKYGWAFVNVNIRPYYAEGSKSMGHEIAEQFGWRLPDHVVVDEAVHRQGKIRGTRPPATADGGG